MEGSDPDCSSIVVHSTTKPIEWPVRLSDVSQQLYTEELEALTSLTSNEEKIQKARALTSTERDDEMHRLQTDNKELQMRVRRLENALVRLEQFSGTLQRKLTGQRQSGSGPLIGMSGILTLGTESQLQVIKDLTRENVQLKVARMDKSQPQAVEAMMVINELQNLNTVLRLEKARLFEELAEIRNLNVNIGKPEQEASLKPLSYLDQVNQLELRLEAQTSLIESLSNELEKVMEEGLKWKRKEEMLNRTVGNLRRMVEDMRQQMVAYTQRFSGNNGVAESQQLLTSRHQPNIAVVAASVSVQTEISMDELGRFEDEICQLDVGVIARTAETRHEIGGHSLEGSLAMQANASAGDILLPERLLVDSTFSSITEDNSSTRGSDVFGTSSSKIDSGVSQLEQESVRVHSKETVKSSEGITARETDDNQTVDERILKLKDELSSIRLEKETLEVQLMQLNEIVDNLQQQNGCMMENQQSETGVIRMQRERLQVKARGGDYGEEMWKELEVGRKRKQFLGHKVDELTDKVAMSKQEIETLKRDLEFEQQAHQTTKEQMVVSKEVAKNELQKLRHQAKIDKARFEQLKAAKNSADSHNQELQEELDQLAEQHIRLQTENREHMTQVQYLQGQVLNKDDEVQKHQRLVEEARRQIREMKQERHASSLGYEADKVSEVARRLTPLANPVQGSLKSQLRIKSGEQPHAIAHQTVQSTSEQQPQGSQQYDAAASSVLCRTEPTPLQKWMQKEGVTSTVHGRKVRSSDQPSNSPVKPVLSYSSQPSHSSSSSPYHPASDTNRTVSKQTHQSALPQWQQPSRSLTDKVLECPRCQKKFSASDFSQYREHLEQCLT